MAAPMLESPHSVEGALVQVLDEAESKSVLTKYGVSVPASSVVQSPEEAVAAASELGYPVVVKALGVAHKTEVGGVRLGLANEEAVRDATEEMSHLAERFLVEKMVEGGVAELLVGVARDPQFGPYLIVGGGGILVELLKDSQSILLPVERDRVLEKLARLKCAPLFEGFRGRSKADLGAAADAILAIASLAEDEASSIVELDVNPLILLAEGQGAVAADALLSLKTENVAEK